MTNQACLQSDVIEAQTTSNEALLIATKIRQNTHGKNDIAQPTQTKKHHSNLRSINKYPRIVYLTVFFWGNGIEYP